MPEAPKVTVLMSIYNAEAFLRQTMDSILGQTFTDFEFLIIDDCSQDSSVEIIESYADQRIRMVHNDQNVGLTKSLNTGLELAKGEYIARTDADDISLPTRLQKQVDFLDSNPTFGLVASFDETIDDSGAVTYRRDYWRPTPEDLYFELTFHNCFTHSSVMLRRELVIGLGGYDESFRRSQDMDLWFRLSRKVPIVVLPEVLIQYRDTQGNISNHFKTEQIECAERIFTRNLAAHLQDQIDPQDLMCFEGNRVKYNLPLGITAKTLSAYRTLSAKLAADAPAQLDRKQFAEISASYLKELSPKLAKSRPQLLTNCWFLRLFMRKTCEALGKRMRIYRQSR